MFSYLTYRDPLRFGELESVRRLEWYPTLLLLGVSSIVVRTRPSSDRPVPVGEVAEERAG